MLDRIRRTIGARLPLVGVVSLIAAIVAGFAQVAPADEGGVPFWFSGQYASFATVPVAPGWSMPIQAYRYSGSASAEKELPRGNVTTAGLDSTMSLVLAQPTWAPTTKVWGGQLALGLGFGWGNNGADADLAVSGLKTELDRRDSVTSFTDLYPIASLAWNKGNDNWMTYLTGDIPIGDYDPDRLANIGIGHGAIDAGGGYTYFEETKGREFSAVVGVTYNLENDDTGYQNGVDVHLDWAASQFLNKHWQVGLAGYAYGQLTDDDRPDGLDGFRSSIAAIGPEIGYSFSVNGQPAYANLRGYWEFAAANRIEGTAVFATLSIPLGHKASKNNPN